MPEHDEFYIGYLPEAPAGMARFTRRIVIGLLVTVGSLAVLLVSLQQSFDRSVFEYQKYRDFEGRMQEQPYPLLLVDRPGETPADEKASRYHLVPFGKVGAADLVRGMDGQRVHLQGALVYRDDQTMIELLAGSIEAAADRGVATPSLREDFGTHTLVGEIVDLKCYLGVMKPGRGKPHRACAARCIAGGLPPVLLVETEGGERAYFLLSDEQGRGVGEEVVDLVAETVEITGRVQRSGALLLLSADPSTYRRINNSDAD